MITREQLAKQLLISPRTLYRWERWIENISFPKTEIVGREKYLGSLRARYFFASSQYELNLFQITILKVFWMKKIDYSHSKSVAIWLVNNWQKFDFKPQHNLKALGSGSNE